MMSMVRVCVRVCVRACMRACMRVCVHVQMCDPVCMPSVHKCLCIDWCLHALCVWIACYAELLLSFSATRDTPTDDEHLKSTDATHCYIFVHSPSCMHTVHVHNVNSSFDALSSRLMCILYTCCA